VSEGYPLWVSVATPFDKHHIAIRIDLTIEQLVYYPQRLVPCSKGKRASMHLTANINRRVTVVEVEEIVSVTVSAVVAVAAAVILAGNAVTLSVTGK